MYRYLIPIMLLLTAPSVAQNCKYIPSNTPTTGVCDPIPFGTTKSSLRYLNQKYQTIILATQLGKTPGSICEIAFAACGTAARNFDSLVIKMNHTNLTTFVGNTNFAKNLGTNATTVLSVKNYTWYNTANQWNRIGLQKSFMYRPVTGKSNVIIEIECRNVGTARSAAGFQGSTGSEYPDRLYAFGWNNNPPATGTPDRAGLKIEVCFDVADLSLFGTSCVRPRIQMFNHTLVGSAKIGQTVAFDVTGAPPIALLVLGVSNGAPFPVLLPGTNCNLFISPDLIFPVVISAIGSGRFKAIVPNLPCVRFYSQYVVLRRNVLDTTNYGRILIGN